MSANNLNGLRGWLILLAIGVVIAPIRLLLEYGLLYYFIFTDGTFAVLTDPSFELYSPFWGPLLVGEAVLNSLFFVAALVLVYLFFSKHYWFPRLYIGIAVCTLIFIPIDVWLGSLVLVNEPMLQTDAVKDFMLAFIGSVIWIPYLLVSKRVKATFVRNKPQSEHIEPELAV